MQKILKDFESYLIQNPILASSFHPYYEKALWEMVLNGGKRFRPALLLSVVYALNPKKLKDSYKVALALEILHTYSLIHDDLPAMDNSALRRGATTLHVKYDEAGAILIGDALNTQSFYLLSTAKFNSKIKTQLVKILSKNAGATGMVLGQALDCFFEGQKLPLTQLKTIHLNKTAKLIASSLQMGGVISKISKKDSKKLYKIGLDLGLFFQIRDDIIDVTQNEIEAGKQTHNDEKKNSYVNLLGLQKTKEASAALQNTIKKELTTLPKKLQKTLLSILNPYFFKENV